MKRACKNFNNKHEKSTCEFSSIIGKCFHIGRKIINLATIITLLSFNNISAQQKNIDSLQNKLELASINEKPVILNDISEEYFNNNNAEMAEKYSSDAIISSRKTSNIYEEARGYKNRSAALLLQSRYNEAVESAEKSINYFLKINKSKEAAET